jgi:hypothetical protein
MPRKVKASFWEFTYMTINDETIRKVYHDSRTTEKTTKQASGNHALPAPLDKTNDLTVGVESTYNIPVPVRLAAAPFPAVPLSATCSFSVQFLANDNLSLESLVIVIGA